MMLKLPKRPTISNESTVKKISRPIQLITNMFAMQVEVPLSSDPDSSSSFNSNIMCYQYDVSFIPAIEDNNRNLRYKIFNACKKNIENIIGKFSFSGKSLFTMKKLNEKKINQISHIDSININSTLYSIRITYSNQFDMKEEFFQQDDTTTQGLHLKTGNQVTQVLNIILKGIIRDEKFQEIGRNSKFFNIQNKTDIVVRNENGNVSKVLEVCKGLSFGVIPTFNKMFLMVDYASRILIKGTALQFIQQNNNIVGESVITEYNNYQIYKIDKVDKNKNPQSTFLYKQTNNSITYVDYFKQRYDIQIKDLKQPLLVHNRRLKQLNNLGEIFEQVYLVPEICKMAGVTNNSNDYKSAKQEILKETKLSPQKRYDISVEYCKLLSEKAQYSSIKIDHTQNAIKAIQLNPPKIYYSEGGVLIPENGNFDFKQKTLDSVKFQDWFIIFQLKDQQKANKLIENLKKASQIYGIKIEEPFKITTNSLNADMWIELMDQEFKCNDLPQFILTFAEDKNNLYTKLKFFLSSQVGIESQHVNPRTHDKNQMSIYSKIILQIATKIGKRIWRVEIPSGISQYTMIIGIETSMKKVKNRQVIGVVASISQDFTNYYSDIDFRSQNDTTLSNLTDIIAKSITAYFKNIEQLPQDIIIYRQGLGEGQIQKCLNQEISAIQRGFKQYSENYNPHLAFFQVNKKVGQKFYQLNAPKMKDSISNPNTGTIVASEVVQNNFEFFMAAQNCNSGVCTPTKYTCLFNETNLKEDQFWQLTYFQTFNYYNWQGPVRVPAAMKYAEKLAKYTSEVIFNDTDKYLKERFYYL